MVIDRHTLAPRREPCSRLVLLLAAGVLFVLTAGLSRACDGPPESVAASADFLPAQSFSPGQGCPVGVDVGLSRGLSLREAMDAADGVDAQAPSADQTTRPSGSASPPAADQKPGAEVNPITGMAVAQLSNYNPLTLNERWKLYLKMTFASAGPYFSPLVNALLDQASGTPRQWGGGFSNFLLGDWLPARVMPFFRALFRRHWRPSCTRMSATFRPASAAFRAAPCTQLSTVSLPITTRVAPL